MDQSLSLGGGGHVKFMEECFKQVYHYTHMKNYSTIFFLFLALVS